MRSIPKEGPKPPKKPRSIPRKRVKKRTWTCVACHEKQAGVKSCESCKTRKTTKRTGLKAKCDRLARELCRDLADGKCARCGGPGSDWAHRMPRRNHSVRWDVLTNSDFLCRKDHRFLTDHPATYFAFIVQQMGSAAAYEELERRANTPWDKSYERVLADLKVIRENLGKLG